MSEKPEDRLVLSTRKSLYAPIEITIDDRTYYSKKTTHAVLMEINKLDSAVGKESTEALYKVVRLMFDIEQKVLEKLDKREVEDIYIFAKKKFSESLGQQGFTHTCWPEKNEGTHGPFG